MQFISSVSRGSGRFYPGFRKADKIRFVKVYEIRQGCRVKRVKNKTIRYTLHWCFAIVSKRRSRFLLDLTACTQQLYYTAIRWLLQQLHQRPPYRKWSTGDLYVIGRHLFSPAGKSDDISVISSAGLPADLLASGAAALRQLGERFTSFMHAGDATLLISDFAYCYGKSSVCPPVCPSVTFRYRDHVGWKYSNKILRLVSMDCSFNTNINIMDLLQREHIKNFTQNGVGGSNGAICGSIKPDVATMTWHDRRYRQQQNRCQIALFLDVFVS